jgi:endoglucanase
MSLDHGFYTIFSADPTAENQDAFFSNKEFRDAFKNLWKQIASRYKSDKRGVAYDLMNEPHDEVAHREWPKYAKELSQAVRAIDKTHTIVIEPADWSWPDGFKSLNVTGDKNTVYSFHFYGPMDFTHQRGYDSAGKFTGHLTATEEQTKARKYPGFIQGENWNKAKIKESLAAAFKFRDRHHVRIWCGEFGVTRWANGAEAWLKDIIDVMELEKVGWSYYSFREWQAMDMEMSPDIVNRPTIRTETDSVKLLETYFGKNITSPSLSP